MRDKNAEEAKGYGALLYPAPPSPTSQLFIANLWFLVNANRLILHINYHSTEATL